MAQADGVSAPAIFTGHSGSASKHDNMSLFERLNAEKGLQLPVFGTPVMSAPRHQNDFVLALVSIYTLIYVYKQKAAG